MLIAPVVVEWFALASPKLHTTIASLTDDDVRRLLMSLAERGGRMTRAALAQRMGLPEYRLDHLVTATRRVLNVDGIQVLDVEAASTTVILNQALLQQQFEV